jgi:hypothetical protein
MMLFEPTTLVRKRFKRRIERYVSGTVDDHIGVRHDLGRLFFGHSEKLVADVAVYRHDLFTDEIFKLVAVFLAKRIEGRARNDARPKSGIRFVLVPRTHGRIDLSRYPENYAAASTA